MERFGLKIPEMDQVPDANRIAVNDFARMTVYSPVSRGLYPAVVFVPGDASDERMRDIDGSEQYTSWGRLAAASGLVGITTTHRSSNGGATLDAAARDVREALRQVRDQAADLGVDPARICLWTCSAGPPIGLAPLLRDWPSALTCAVIYYGVMTFEGFSWSSGVAEADLRTYSCIDALRSAPNLPSMLIARAGMERPQVQATLDDFIAVARHRGLDLTVLEHPDGVHGFDVRTPGRRTAEIIQLTLDFIRRHTLAKGEVKSK